MPTWNRGSNLCVHVRPPVCWRKSSHLRPNSPDRKTPVRGRLRLFNVGASSFNKLLAVDMAVSSRPRRQQSNKARGARIVRAKWLGREPAFAGGRDVPNPACARYIRRRAAVGLPGSAPQAGDPHRPPRAASIVAGWSASHEPDGGVVQVRETGSAEVGQ
jgi:hypothetical protein